MSSSRAKGLITSHLKLRKMLMYGSVYKRKERMANPWKNITSERGKKCKIIIRWLTKGKSKGKVKFHPRTGHEQAQRSSRGIALLLL